MKTRPRRSESQTPQPKSPLSPLALRTFCALDPRSQFVVLDVIAALASTLSPKGGKRLPTSRLFATAAQRQAAHKMRTEQKQRIAEREAREQEHAEIRSKLNAIYNRATLRKSRRGYLTAAEEQRVNALQARINEIHNIGGLGGGR